MRVGSIWRNVVHALVLLTVALVPITTGSAPSLAADAVPPGPVTNVWVDPAGPDNELQVAWLLPADADGAVVCVYLTSVPPAPDSDSCSAVQQRSYTGDFLGEEAQPNVAVFSYNSVTGLFGPPAYDTDETPPPFRPGDVSSRGIDDTSLDLAFYDDSPGGQTTWVVRQAIGTTAPALSTAPVAESPVKPESGKYLVRVTGLSPQTTYTFSVQGRDARGNVSEHVQTHTTRTRGPGTHVQSSEHRPRTSIAPASGMDPRESAIAVDRSSGRVHEAHMAVTAEGQTELYYSNRLPGSDWARATKLAADHSLGNLSLSRSRRGTLLVSWNNCWRMKREGKAWTPKTCLRDRYELKTLIDRSDHLHVLSRTPKGLEYRTNASGAWTSSKVLSVADVTRQWAARRWAIDPITDRLVLVVARPGDYPRWRIQVATKSARASHFGAFYTRASGTSRNRLMPSDVISYDGRITIALQLVDHLDPFKFGTVRVMTGSSAARVSAPVTMRGTSWNARHPGLAAESRNRIVFGWTYQAQAVADSRNGVWVSRGTRANGRWAFSTQQQRTWSPFDQLMAIGSGKTRTVLAFRRMQSSTERLSQLYG